MNTEPEFGTIVYESRLRGPRSMYIGDGLWITENGGMSGLIRSMTREEWFAWLDGFMDITRREYVIYRDEVEKPFVEPQEWTEYRQRFKATGSPWID